MHRALLLISLLACAKAPAPPTTCSAAPTAEGLRKTGPGSSGTLLPSGRRVAPVGETLQVGQGPQALAVSADGTRAALAEFGVNLRGLSVAALETPLRLAAQPVQALSGGYRAVAFDKDGALWALNSGAKRIEKWNPALDHHDEIALQGDWPAAFALSADGASLYVAAALSNRVELYDAHSGTLLKTAPSGGLFPQALLLDEEQGVLYVANQGAAPGKKNRVLALEAKSLAQLAWYEVGKNPAALALSRDPGRRILYVAASDDDWIDRIDLDARGALTPIPLAQPGTGQQAYAGLASSACWTTSTSRARKSVEGHFWATASTTNDYFERNWAAPWGGHVIAPMPLPPSGLTPLDTPRAGFVFDQLSRQRIGYTSYGEFVGVSGDLQKHLDLRFVDNPVSFLLRPDTEKLPVFLDALAAGKLQPFTFVALQYDHTYGLAPGKPDPSVMIADNDRATGLLVDAVSHSPYWSDALILITEDDPSGATDHVDLHRSFALVVSPWARRERISHVRASFPSIAATYERALGLEPLSALDAQAEPLWDCLADRADPRPFTALQSNVALKTNPLRPGWRDQHFSGVDRAQLGVELWQAARPGDPVPRRLLEAEPAGRSMGDDTD